MSSSIRSANQDDSLTLIGLRGSDQGQQCFNGSSSNCSWDWSWSKITKNGYTSSSIGARWIILMIFQEKEVLALDQSSYHHLSKDLRVTCVSDRYHDAMAIVARLQSSDRPDLVVRVSSLKLKAFLTDITKKWTKSSEGVFGRRNAQMHLFAQLNFRREDFPMHTFLSSRTMKT